MDSTSLPNPCLLYPIQLLLDIRLQLKGTLLPVFFLLYFTPLIAQSPQQFSCQGVVRDASDNLISNTTIGVQITIRQGGASGANVFRETHSPVTNGAGIFAIEIGTGQTVNGSLSAINWEMGPFFIEQAIDLSGGNSYNLTSTTELLSVPFALHARTVDRATQVAVADTAAGVSNAGLLGLSIGTVMLFAGDDSSVPNGWLLCDGSSYSQSAYPALFSLIGTTYGMAPPSGEFYIPDLRGRGPMGRDGSQTEFVSLGQTGGSNTHTLTLSELPAHDHGGAQEDGSHVHNVGTRGFLRDAAAAGKDFAPGGNGSGSDFQFTKFDGSHQHTISQEGGGGEHNNLQPYYTINFIIKAN